MGWGCSGSRGQCVGRVGPGSVCSREGGSRVRVGLQWVQGQGGTAVGLGSGGVRLQWTPVWVGSSSGSRVVSSSASRFGSSSGPRVTVGL